MGEEFNYDHLLGRGYERMNKFRDSKMLRDVDIPKKFSEVIKKLSPEIIDVKVISYEMIQEDIQVNVELYFNDDKSVKGGVDYYNTKLTDYFIMSHSDHNFIKFNVLKVHYPSKLEMFKKLFNITN